LQKHGQGWIRTSEGVKPADLQSAPFGHFGTYPFASVDIGSRFMHCKWATDLAGIPDYNYGGARRGERRAKEKARRGERFYNP
jgi:hypothetical protein